MSLLGSLPADRTGVALDVALLLGIEAIKLADSPAAGNGLFFTLNAHPDLVSMLHGHAQHVQALAYSPDGKTLASASWDSIKLWDSTATAELGISIPTPRSPKYT